MAAKTAGTWQCVSEIGIGDLTTVDTTAAHALGKRIRAKDMGSTQYGYGEFIYLSGVTSTARGSAVAISGTFSTTLLAARVTGNVGVALAAVDASTKFGWYQVAGKGVVLCDAGVVDAAALYIDGTAGRVDDTVVAGDAVQGMRASSTDDTNTCLFVIPVAAVVGDADNA
jgi:hypothetical protein